MTYRTTLRLLATVLILGGLMWLLERKIDPTDRRRDRQTRVLTFEPDDVVALTVEQDGYPIDLRRRGESWWIDYPVAARADDGVVTRLLDALEALPRLETIKQDQRVHRGLSLADYGLELPRTSLTIESRLERQSLMLGNKGALGDLRFVRLEGSTDVMTTRGALDEVMPLDLDALRDRRVFRGRPERVSRLEVERPEAGFIQVLRGDSGWMLQQPLKEPADPAAVNRLVETLYGVTIERFVLDPPVERHTQDRAVPEIDTAAPLRVETYGLAEDESVVRLRVWETGDETGRELIVGKPADDAGEVYARLGGDAAVFTVSTNLLGGFRVTVDAMRRRELVDMPVADIRYVALQRADQRLALVRDEAAGWALTEPIEWPADRQTVADLLGSLSAARATGFRAAPPTNAAAAPEGSVLKIVLAARPPVPAQGPAGEQIPGCVLRVLPSGTAERVLVERSGYHGLCEAPSLALQAVEPGLASPLAFFDRTVLALPPDHVRSLSVKRDGRTQAISRDESGTWSASAPPDAVPAAEAIAAALLHLANLRALQVAAHSVTGLEPYGLAGGGPSLTVGLAGDDAIRKTIMLGSAAPGGGVYAMIQGQDVVFVLPARLAARLTGNLVTGGGTENGM